MPLILLVTVLVVNYPHNNMRHYYYAHDHADNILKSLEPDAILIPSGDHNTFPVIYRHYVEGARPDIIIADKYGYIEYKLYKDMPNAPRRIRTQRERQEIEAYLIKHSGRPVYYTVQPRLALLGKHRVISSGMLFRICVQGEETPRLELPEYHYRNMTGIPTVRDHAASVILADYYFSQAARSLRAKKTDQALEYVKTAAELSTGLKEEMNNLATLLAEYGLTDPAIVYYERAARLDPRYSTPRWNLAHLFKARGDVVHAIQVLNDLAGLEPKDHRIFGELGFLLHKHGDVELAIKNWGKSLSLNPDQPQIIKAISEFAGE